MNLFCLSGFIFTISLSAAILTPDLQDAFFAGEDFLSKDHFSENYHQHPSRLIAKETDPESYLKLKSEIQVELSKYKHVQDPEIQFFMNWIQSRIDRESPLSYNDKVYTAFCGHAEQNLFHEDLPSIEKIFLDWEMKNACTLPPCSLLQNDSHFPFGLNYEKIVNKFDGLLSNEAHDPLFIPEENLGAIGLVPLIQLMLQNAYPIAFTPGHAHGVDFLPAGFGLHDYAHFDASVYFKNLYNFYEHSSNAESLMKETHSYLMSFTQYHADRIKSGNCDESMQSRRIIVALFIALHETFKTFPVNQSVRSSAEDLVKILRLHTPFELSDYMDLTFETSPIDGRILVNQTGDYFSSSVKKGRCSKDGYSIEVPLANGSRKLLLSNRYYYGESEDCYALLNVAGIEAERFVIDSQLDHVEAYNQLKNSQSLWIKKVNELRQELAVELCKHSFNQF